MTVKDNDNKAVHENRSDTAIYVKKPEKTYKNWTQSLILSAKFPSLIGTVDSSVLLSLLPHNNNGSSEEAKKVDFWSEVTGDFLHKIMTNC